MKRSVLLLAGLVLLAALLPLSELPAQQPAADEVVVTQKIRTHDGTTIVKKRTFQKGEDFESYLKALKESSPDAAQMDIIISTDQTVDVHSFRPSDDEDNTVFFFRQALQNGFPECQDGNKSMQELRIRMQELETLDAESKLQWEELKAMKLRHQQERPPKKVLLGIYPGSEKGGVRVQSVIQGSGAERAGLRAGDLITHLDGQAVELEGGLGKLLARYEPGDAPELRVLRGDAVLTLHPVLSEYRPDEPYSLSPCRVFIGVYVGGARGGEGVAVMGIVPNTPAERAGLQRGDRILALDEVPVTTHSELLTQRNKHQPGDHFTLTVLRGEEVFEVEAQFGPCPEEESTPQTENATPALPNTPQPELQLEFREFTAYPNPSFGPLQVRFQGQALPTILRIVDMNGKVVREERYPHFDGFLEASFELSNETPGNYVVTIQQAGKVQSKPFVLMPRA